MRLLVTGGAGYVGSVVTGHLLEAGHDVTVLDDLSTGHQDAVPAAARFVEADLTDVGQVLAEGGYEGVLHFAAKSLVGESTRNPGLYWRTNVGGTRALLDAMRQHGVRRIVFSSTSGQGALHRGLRMAGRGDPRGALPGPRSRYPARVQPAPVLAALACHRAGCRTDLRGAWGKRRWGSAGPRRAPGGRAASPPALQGLRAPGRGPADGGTGLGAEVVDEMGAGWGRLECEQVRTSANACMVSSSREVLDTVDRVTGRRVTRRTAPLRAGDPAFVEASRPEQVREDAAAAGLVLDPDLVLSLDQVLGPVVERSAGKVESWGRRP